MTGHAVIGVFCNRTARVFRFYRTLLMAIDAGIVEYLRLGCFNTYVRVVTVNAGEINLGL